MRVFLSYSHVDKAVADNIVAMLDELGVHVFRDERAIDWGDSIQQEVRLGIEQCDVLMFVASPASIKSSWVIFEIGYASALGKRILPFLTHPSLEVPDFVRGLKRA